MVGGFVARLVMSFITERDLASLEARVKRIEMKLISGSGVDARQEKAERQQEAMLKAAELMKAGKEPKEALKEVAMAYPDVAMDLVQKAMRGGKLGNLGGLLTSA